jgi:hypothetical protein
MNVMEKFQRRSQLVRDYQHVFGSVAGQRVLHDLMHVGHMLRPTYVVKDRDQMTLREGERNMVLRILTILKTDPEKLREMIEEGEKNNE